MEKEYIKFVICYDFGIFLNSLDLACDEAYTLADKIADKYIEFAKEQNLCMCYDELYSFCEGISFSDIWKEIKGY